MRKPARKKGFEVQLQELEEIVRKLEGGSLPLEESLVLFERGISLSRELQASLQAASLRVTRLLEGEGTREVPFESEGPERGGGPP
jgi:exodeoxyribonuclease VII small subunit